MLIRNVFLSIFEFCWKQWHPDYPNYIKVWDILDTVKNASSAIRAISIGRHNRYSHPHKFAVRYVASGLVNCELKTSEYKINSWIINFVKKEKE